MRFEIPTDLIPKLRELQSELRKHSNQVLGSEDAVLVMRDFGQDMFLTFDGRVIILEWINDSPPREVSDPKEAYSAIVLGAEFGGAPWLLSLLPTRPRDVPDCEACKGRGFVTIMKDIGGNPMEKVCSECGGSVG